MIGCVVIDADKEQALRRRNGAASGAIAGGKSRPDIGGAPFAFADKLQCAHHRAHLMMQE